MTIPHWPLLLAALACVIGASWLQRAAMRHQVPLSPEEYARRVEINERASRTELTPGARRVYRIAELAFWAGYALLFVWWFRL